mgnify:CR=1 FL=1
MTQVLWHRPGVHDVGQAVIAIGVFDGVHIGHQALVTDAVERARRTGIVSVVLTFDDGRASVGTVAAPLLERHGMTVRTAGNAEEARDIFHSAPLPAAILVDSGLPGTDGFACASWLRLEAGYTGPVIMMLTFTHLKRKSECAGLGVNATLLKPFGTRDLLQALAKGPATGCDLASTGAEARSAAPPLSKPGETVQPAARSSAGTMRALRILVAEDTPVNQKFILRLLDRWGHTVVLAGDGRNAVAEASRAAFDVVLMDVQMPEMDGLEAAAAIRRHETGSHRHTPIIAMTAHAIKGDRERCLVAGMDDYLSKPIDAELLRQTIERLTAVKNLPETAASDPAPVPEFLKAFENDWGFFEEGLEVFFKDYPCQIDSLRRSAASGDATTFHRAAHSLKGMLRNFQAEGLAQKALHLENKSQAADLADVGPLVDELAENIARLEADLRRLIEKKMPKMSPPA